MQYLWALNKDEATFTSVHVYILFVYEYTSTAIGAIKISWQFPSQEDDGWHCIVQAAYIMAM